MNKIYPHQKTLIDHLHSGGFKPGEISIIMSGRRAGKSMLNQMYGSMMMAPKPKFEIRDQAPVDGRTWYTVSCSYDASQWIRRQSRTLWHEHINGKWDVIHNTFDIDEKLYTLLALRWS